MMLARIIPSSFIRWIDNLPEWAIYAAVGSFILCVLVIMFLLIRKVNARPETQKPAVTPRPAPQPPIAATRKPAPMPAAKPAPQPVSAPVPKPQPAAPVQSRPTSPAPAVQSPARPVPEPVSKPQPQISQQPVPVAVPVQPATEAPSESTIKNTAFLDSAVYNKIASLSGSGKIILFAGAGLEHLPVTIPVQTAAKLAAAGKKIMLIDLDMKRNAVAKVFDPNETVVKSCTRPRLLSSPIENLSYWPSEFFVRFGQMNLRMVVQSALSQFEIIFINAPYLDGHPDRKLIASCAKYGLIFCNTQQQFERLQALLAAGDCQLLESKPISC